MPCSAKFSMTSKTEIFSAETSDFLKQISSLESFFSVNSRNHDNVTILITDNHCHLIANFKVLSLKESMALKVLVYLSVTD